MVYINLEETQYQSRDEAFHVCVAENGDEASNLVQAWSRFVTGEYGDGDEVFRKRK